MPRGHRRSTRKRLPSARPGGSYVRLVRIILPRSAVAEPGLPIGSSFHGLYLDLGRSHELVNWAGAHCPVQSRALFVAQGPVKGYSHAQPVLAAALFAAVALDVRLDALERNSVALRIPHGGESFAGGERAIEVIVRVGRRVRAARVGADVGAKHVRTNPQHLGVLARTLRLAVDGVEGSFAHGSVPLSVTPL